MSRWIPLFHSASYMCPYRLSKRLLLDKNISFAMYCFMYNVAFFLLRYMLLSLHDCN